jgi:hypothetical protein
MRGRARTPKACAKCNGRCNRFCTQCFGVHRLPACVRASSHRFVTAFPLAGELDLCFEFDAGLLHFTVGQQPDE